MMGITTLEEYFSWLKTLTDHSKDRKYTVLPLGEEVFDINANTRAITVPVNYKKNGVGVQGDDLAEVLYFRIDRYFDYMDFNNTDIFIQWETPKAKDGTVTKRVSPAYIRDIESEPGKLIFGWALSDDITAQAGALKFSVRFFQWTDADAAQQDKTLAYSFSTLTTTVNIHPSINLDIEKDQYEIDDCGDRLIERLKDSVVVGGYAAATPEFRINLENKPTGYDLEEDGTYRLLVQAFASDTGAISYEWKKQGLNEDNTTAGTDIITIESINEFVPADMDNLNKDYAYYRLDAYENPTLYKGNIPPTAADKLLKEEVLYTKQSMCIADDHGVYWAVAKNRITNSASYTDSVKAKFLRPEEVKIATQPDDKVILDEDGASLAVFHNNNDGEVSYQWYYAANKALDFDGAEQAFAPLEGETASTLIPTEEGHYKVCVTNTRNKDSKSLDSSISRVTKPAAVPNVLMPSDKNFLGTELMNGVYPYVELDIENAVDSDYYIVEWYRYDSQKGAFTYLYKEALDNDIIRSELKPEKYADKDDAGNYIISSLEGLFYPVVINHLNGSSAATSKDDISSDDMFSVQN